MENRAVLEMLKNFDRTILLSINPGWHNPLCDAIMVGLSATPFWLFIFVSYLAFLGFRRRWQLMAVCFFILAAVLVIDALSYHLLKPFFNRFRPCKELADLRIVAGCAGWHSFPSNHATNSIATAVLFYLLVAKKVGLSLACLAIFISFSRLYLGVHYPGDILFGWLLGGCYAGLVGLLAKRFLFRVPPLNQEGPVVSG